MRRSEAGGAGAGRFGVHLMVALSTPAPGPATIAVMAFGEAPAGRIIRRGGARVGDAIFVTGTIGDAALGLATLNDALPSLGANSAAFCVIVIICRDRASNSARG